MDIRNKYLHAYKRKSEYIYNRKDYSMCKKNIHINQIGYRLKDKKIAITTVKSSSFNIIEENTGNVVFTGELTGGKYDQYSDDTLYDIDFSALQRPGTYYISLKEGENSHTFEIGDNIYKDIKNAFLKFLYYQRCGCNLDKEYTGVWNHKACHDYDAYLFNDEGEKIEITGGWHDAGDHGRYSVPTAVTIGHLLLAYEFFPDKFNDPIGIPNNGKLMPDILDETKYGLEWMLKMQESKSGGVYHKVTSKQYPPNDLVPENDKSELIVCPISSTATGDFAAVMAKASITYAKFDIEFSNKCLEASKKAWSWLIENDTYSEFINPNGVESFTYADESNQDLDERFWAACELYRATGDVTYHDFIKKLLEENKFDLFGLGWSDVGGFGTIAYIRTENYKVNETLYKTLRESFFNQVELLQKASSTDGYKISLCREDYKWGSNMVLLKNAALFIIAGVLTDDNNYYNIALDHFDYLLGRNSLGQSFVTHYGSNAIRYPHHRQCMAYSTENPIPGVVSGGPNIINLDEQAKEKFNGRPIAKCFEDNSDFYSVNEVATYWNSLAVFVSACFDRSIG